ncbi:MAG: hypothetical protein OEW42_17235 [Acidimicrobiia bacterium]|nr:hypothetical protein [Acidimicrobiia bacterium]
MHLKFPLVLLASVALFTASCGGSDGDGGAAERGGDGTVTVTDGAGDGDDVATQLFTEGDFAPVCRGTGIAVATDFTPGPGVHKVAVLGGEDPEYGLVSVTLPDGWEPEFDDLTEVQLVACADRTAVVEKELCEGYEDEGLEWSIQTYDVTWEIMLREATTTDVVAETTLEAVADGCPMVSFYSEGDPSPVPDYATPGAELEVFLKEFVNP